MGCARARVCAYAYAYARARMCVCVLMLLPLAIRRLIRDCDIWNTTRENLPSGVCEQHRRRPACRIRVV